MTAAVVHVLASRPFSWHIHRNGVSDSVTQQLVFVGNEQGKLVAIRQLIQAGLRPPVLIFVQSLDRAKELFRELVYDGINVDVIHSGLPRRPH